MLEHQSRERELSRDLSAIMAAVDSGIITLDRSGHIRSMNAAAVRILDGAIDEVSSLLGLLGQDELTPGTPETVELQSIRRPDRWFEVTRYASPGPDRAQAVVIRDITEARRSRGLREAFLGMLSHELRTPVTSIYAATSLLRSSEGLSEEDRDGLIDDISEEADRLLRLVEDLLVLAHFDGGLSLVREPSLLQRVIPPVVQRERRRWPGQTIELRVDSEVPVVTGDETSVQQVVRNLISNAAKYGESTPIEIEIAPEDDPARGATVRVLDRGPGVSAHEAEALFRPFFRSSRVARASSGAGIGLYVCRQLVEAMGGRIWAQARDGSGSEFGFWLPEYRVELDDESDALEPEEAESRASSGQRPRRPRAARTSAAAHHQARSSRR